MKGGSTEGNGGPSDNFRSEGKGDRSSASEERSGSMKRNSASDERSGSMKKHSASDERSDKSDRHQAADENRGGKDRDSQASDRDHNRNKDNDRADRGERQDKDKMRSEANDRSRGDRGATGTSEGAEGKSRPRGSITSISPEQKTRVRSAFIGHRVSPARDIGVAVNVGVVVPRSVHFYPIPQDIVTIVPDYSGYEYFMIDESHVAIVDPDTLEVVDIIVVA